MIYAFKISILASYNRKEVRQFRKLEFLLWPGMDPERLTIGGKGTDADARPIGRGLVALYIGMALWLVAAILPIPAMSAGWLAIAGSLLIVHFGLSELLSSVFRLAGRPVRPLFNRPLGARSLNEFWTRRWNMPFVEMDRRLFVPGLLRRFGYRGAILGVFLISGLLHEMAISYPTGSGWGFPMIYFAVQGALVLVEHRFRIRSRLFTWVAILAPLPLVFTPSFQAEFMLPLVHNLRSIVGAHPMEWYFDRGLWVMGAAHFLVLVASFQVPSKLNWKEELPRLSSFNRKLMYAYGAFIMLTIVTFGVFTLTMHRELLRGSAPALFVAGFVAVFWLLRIGLDAFYYRHEDWPKGPQFVVGHALLTSLFAFLSLSYGGLLLWKLVT
jgi:alginate O-acetyltransferase complex protein AlgI